MARFIILGDQMKSTVTPPKKRYRKKVAVIDESVSEEDRQYDSQVTDKFQRVCRICADDNANVALFKIGDNCTLVEDIKIHLSVEVSEGDGLPNRICERCSNQIDDIKKLRTVALESDSRFKFLKIRHEAKIEKTKGSEAVKSLPSYKPMVSCLKCGKEFSSRITCKRHILYCVKPAEPNSSHVCETCGKEFKKKVFYRRHLRTHSDVLPFKCSVCPHRCRASDSLRIHMRTHTGERPFRCELCPKAFSTKSNLNKHVKSHIAQHAYECNECQRGFHALADLNRHQRAVHMGVKDFPCSVCGKEFAWKKEMRKHQIRVHNMEKCKRLGREPDYIKMQRVLETNQLQNNLHRNHQVSQLQQSLTHVQLEQQLIIPKMDQSEIILPYNNTM